MKLQSNLSTTVNHDEFQKWPLLTGAWPLIRAPETTSLIFTGQIKTDPSGQETATCR